MYKKIKIVRHPIPGYEYEFGKPPTPEHLSKISYEEELELFFNMETSAK